MMYNSQFIATVKVGGKVLRENRDVVRLPFGSEYTVYLKNLSSRRAVVNVEIDGQDVLNGNQLVVDANSVLELERFIGDSMLEGRRLRFIERTSQVENYRGVGAEDGIIRVSFQYEQPTVMRSGVLRGFNSTGNPPPFATFNSVTPCGSAMPQNASYGAVPDVSMSVTNCAMPVMDMCYDSAPVNDAGITVEGSRSTQKFHNTYVGALDPTTHVIVLKLLGGTAEEVVSKPITVKTKKKCSSCGKEYKSSLEYCPEDGTYLKAA